MFACYMGSEAPRFLCVEATCVVSREHTLGLHTITCTLLGAVCFFFLYCFLIIVILFFFASMLWLLWLLAHRAPTGRLQLALFLVLLWLLWLRRRRRSREERARSVPDRDDHDDDDWSDHSRGWSDYWSERGYYSYGSWYYWSAWDGHSGNPQDAAWARTWKSSRRVAARLAGGTLQAAFGRGYGGLLQAGGGRWQDCMRGRPHRDDLCPCDPQAHRGHKGRVPAALHGTGATASTGRALRTPARPCRRWCAAHEEWTYKLYAHGEEVATIREEAKLKEMRAAAETSGKSTLRARSWRRLHWAWTWLA